MRCERDPCRGTGRVLARGGEERLQHFPIRCAVGMVHQDGEANRIYGGLANFFSFIGRTSQILSGLGEMGQIRKIRSFKHVVFARVIAIFTSVLPNQM